jgi:DNA polymerase III alpha subunit
VGLYKTGLKDRTLWFDGTTSIPAAQMLSSKFPVRYVDELTPTVMDYNRFVSAREEIQVKTECDPLPYGWNIPRSYQKLDVAAHVMDALIRTTIGVSSAQFDIRARRVAEELQLYKQYGLYDVLRALIYIINTLTTQNVVWGIGRGSSVSSYVLFLIGTHDVDSVAYDLDITDFLHD